MKFTVYDYANNAVEIEISGNIEDIFVMKISVLSGDETGWVVMKDGTVINFDASYSRFESFVDGDYVLTSTEDIEKWLNFDINRRESDTISYCRQRYVWRGFKYDQEEDSLYPCGKESINK